MSGDRTYPEEAAGEFAGPPLSFEDREDRPIEVRGYAPGDAVPDPLVDMYEAFDPGDRAQGIPPSGEQRIREWLETLYGDGYNVVAWHDDRAAGHATLVPDYEEPAESDCRGDGATAHELAIFVLQEYQRAGIGTRLIEGLLGLGQQHGVERVWLTVERWNRPAISLYEKVGFETADARTFEHEMCLRLQ